jgi:hypothetical protein
MKPDVALQLQDRLNREIVGLKTTIEQLSLADTATTMAGLKSGLTITLRSLLRANQVLHDVVKAEAEPPSPIFPFSDLYGK